MQVSKNQAIEWYDSVENYCYAAVEEALKGCRWAGSMQPPHVDSSDIWDVAKTMTEAMLEKFDSWQIDYPELPDTF